MSARDLSEPERMGWRQFWDGWDICPDCVVRKVGSIDKWPVPANYGMSVKMDAKCSRCGCSPPPPLSEEMSRA